MPPWFTPRRVLWTAVLGLSLAFLSYGVVASRAPATECNSYCAAVIAAHSRQLVADRDVARAASVAAETVYVARREKARQAVSAVPMATIATTATSDTIAFADDSSYAIPHRVAQLIVEQRDAMAAQDSALRAADELLQRFRVERTASDSLLVGVEKERDALAQEVKALTPGRLSRGWSAIRTPVTLAAGIALGAYVTSKVAR